MKSLKEVFTPRNREQVYLNERLQSAKWLGWEMKAESAKPETADKAQADALLAHGKPA